MARSARVPTTWRAGRREKDRDAGEEACCLGRKATSAPRLGGGAASVFIWLGGASGEGRKAIDE
jgi:hypothetical protein